MRQKVVPLSRNRATELGPIYCEGCGKFFDHRERSGEAIVLNYHSEQRSPCFKHRGKTGYNLISRLNAYES